MSHDSWDNVNRYNKCINFHALYVISFHHLVSPVLVSSEGVLSHDSYDMLTPKIIFFFALPLGCSLSALLLVPVSTHQDQVPNPDPESRPRLEVPNPNPELGAEAPSHDVRSSWLGSR